MASVLYWRVSLPFEYSGTFIFSKMQVPFRSSWWCHLILRFFFKFFWFFDRFLVFLRCKENFGYLGLMQVCFIMGGSLERFFRMRYHIFPLAISYFHTRYHFCYHTFMRVLYRFQRTTIISSLVADVLYASLSITYYAITHYCIGYCMPQLPSYFLEKKYVNIFSKKPLVAHG